MNNKVFIHKQCNLVMQIKRKNYLPLRTAKKPLKAVAKKGLLQISKGALKRVTIKRVSKEFMQKINFGFSEDEKFAATIIFNLISKNEKVSYDEMQSMVSTMMRRANIKLGNKVANNNSVMVLYKRLVRQGLVEETSQKNN